MQNQLENLLKTVHISPPLYRLEKLAVWGNFSALTAVGRPARSTANGQISDRWDSGRPARSTVAWNREQSSLPVDQPGRPGLSREQISLAVDLVGRPALQPNLACTFVHVGRPTPGSVDRPGQPAEARTCLLYTSPSPRDS